MCGETLKECENLKKQTKILVSENEKLKNHISKRLK
jgi:hypothetical protein